MQAIIYDRHEGTNTLILYVLYISHLSQFSGSLKIQVVLKRQTVALTKISFLICQTGFICQHLLKANKLVVSCVN